jgi:hypothetical protein
LDQAEELLQTAKDVAAKAFGPKNKTVAMTIFSLGQVAEAKSDFNKARISYETARDLLASVKGAEDFVTKIT